MTFKRVHRTHILGIAIPIMLDLSCVENPNSSNLIIFPLINNQGVLSLLWRTPSLYCIYEAGASQNEGQCEKFFDTPISFKKSKPITLSYQKSLLK